MEQLMEKLQIGTQAHRSDSKGNMSQPEDKFARRKRRIVKRQDTHRPLSKMSSSLLRQRQDTSLGYHRNNVYEKVGQ